MIQAQIFMNIMYNHPVLNLGIVVCDMKRLHFNSYTHTCTHTHTHTHARTQNVFVVNAQPTAAPTIILTHQARAPDYLTLTIVGFQLCFFFGGLLGMALLVPALICSIMVGSTTQLGWYGKCFSSSHYSPFFSLSHVLTSCVNTISPFIPSSFHARTHTHTGPKCQ